MTMEALLTLKEVSKKYGNRDVLTKVPLTINKGDCIILSGNNGSGKSTMLRIVSGLIPISSGERMPDRLSKLRMTSTEYLTHMGKISGIPGNNLKNPISELHDFFSLEQSITLKMTHFSKGMLQKNEPNASND